MDPHTALQSDIGERPQLTIEQEFACAQIIHNPRSSDQQRQREIDRLVFANYGFIKSLVAKWCKPGHPNYDDFLQMALLGATIAAQKFQPNPDNPSKFISYCKFWVKQVILEQVIDARGVAIKQQMRSLLRQYRQFCQRYMDEWQDEPSEAQVCAALQISVEVYHQIMDFRTPTVSLNAPLHLDDAHSLADTIPAPDHPISDRLQQIAIQEELLDAFLKMDNPRMMMILMLHFGLLDGRSRSLDEIGFEFGIVRQQVNTILASALAKMRSYIIAYRNRK